MFKSFKSLFKYFSPSIGMDLGTANTLVYVEKKGVVLNEPSVVAIENLKNKNSVIAVGDEAKLMIGKTHGRITAIRPMKDGVIADFEVAEKMISYFIKKACSEVKMISPIVVICVPSGATLVEKRAIQEAANSAGAKQVFLIEEPMAAAIGAGLPVTEPTGSMIVDIGGGTTEIAVISLGGIVYSQSVKVAGDKMDDDIINYIKSKFGVFIGETTAERIKKQIGCAIVSSGTVESSIKIKGRDMIGIPREITITEKCMVDSLRESISSIIYGIKNVLSNIAPELAADIAENGIVLTGGGAYLKNLDKVISMETGLKVRIAEDPLLSVVLGTGKVIENMDKLKNVLIGE
jgi:rod shape-determining protein MreB and related proteins